MMGEAINSNYPVTEEIYANQFLPNTIPGHTLWEKMEVEGKYGDLLTGGGICHFNVGEKISVLTFNFHFFPECMAWDCIRKELISVNFFSYWIITIYCFTHHIN